MRNQLLYYVLKYKSNYQRIQQAIASSEAYEVVPYQGTFLTILDELYPQQLLALQNPPYILFYEGDISLLETKMIAVIGSRKMSEYGAFCCDMLMKYIDQKYTIVSGLAKGVDGYIHELALSHHKTIGVIGCGLDISYPKQNDWLYKKMKKEHLVISEYPFHTCPYAFHFPLRNRIIAALSEFVIVVEANQRSGTFLTVNEALALDRIIYCFPERFSKDIVSGCNRLIQEGADLIVDITCIKEL